MARSTAAPVGGLDRSKLLFRGGVNEVLSPAPTTIDDLYRAHFEGQVPQVRLRDGVGHGPVQATLELVVARPAFRLHAQRADLPWDIEVAGGSRTASRPSSRRSTSGRSSIDGGANQLRLTLGRPKGDVPIRLSSSNQIRIERPAGTAIRLRVAGGVANMEFDRREARTARRPSEPGVARRGRRGGPLHGRHQRRRAAG